MKSIKNDSRIVPDLQEKQQQRIVCDFFLNTTKMRPPLSEMGLVENDYDNGKRQITL